MKGRKWIVALFLLSNFIILEMNIQAEGVLEHWPEEEKLRGVKKNDDFGRMIVDKNSDDSNYRSIQKAIDDAQSGSTIYVKSGTYSEILVINKKINLIGEDRNTTYINPESKKNGYAAKITANGVRLNGFSINNKGPGLYTMGIKISASQTEIEDCNIFNTPVGIAIWSSENIISNCEFWGCQDEGIAFLGSSISECNGNIITGCKFYDNCDGIELQYSSNNVISHCEFYDNSHAGIDAIGSSNNNNIISHCDLYDNDAFGIYLSRSSENQITQCKISNNQIMISSSKDNTVDNCELESIYLRDTTLNIENCEKIEESKIKTVNSVYEIDNEEDVNSVTVSEKVENGKETYYNKFSSFFTLLNLIKSYIRNYLGM
jgi:parallel beta-helix repeat protein